MAAENNLRDAKKTRQEKKDETAASGKRKTTNTPKKGMPYDTESHFKWIFNQ